MSSPTASAPNTTAVPLSPPLSGPNKWGPYSSSKDFDVSMATVVVALVCATAVAFALHVAFALLIRRLRGFPPSSPSSAIAGKPRAEASPQLPGTLVFSSGAAECAICLAELAEGDRVRVLPVCGHGFHAQCIEAWLVGCRSSCPTCRADCRPPQTAIAEP